MPDLDDGESIEVKGSGAATYVIKNVGGAYSCSCPAWRNQSLGIEQRTCKHIRALRGEDAERLRLALMEVVNRPSRNAVAAGAASANGPPASGGSTPEATLVEPPLLLAHRWEMDVDLKGWWLSEKLDGVRAYWDGQRLVSRLGNPFYPPEWFLEGFPKEPLDGELWSGRKLFQRTVSIVRRQDRSDLWKEIRYVVFDAPAHDGAFEDRVAHLETLVGTKVPYASVHKHRRCQDIDDLKDELARVEALGGEGLMMRQPGSRYEAGRSHTLLKVKSFRDAEARVIDYVAGSGRHKGRLGALVVELMDGTRFNVGTGFSDAEREAPPALGSIITFRYQELSDSGVPRFPTYVAVRDDVRWARRSSSSPSIDGRASSKRIGVPIKVADAATTNVRVAVADAATTNARVAVADATTNVRVADTEIGAPTNSSAEGSNAVPASREGDGNAPPKGCDSGPQSHKGEGTSRRRRFELRDGDTRYFWEIERNGAHHRVRFGTFEVKVKRFASEEEAERELEGRIADKLAKGFGEVDD